VPLIKKKKVYLFQQVYKKNHYGISYTCEMKLYIQNQPKHLHAYESSDSTCCIIKTYVLCEKNKY